MIDLGESSSVSMRPAMLHKPASPPLYLAHQVSRLSPIDHRVLAAISSEIATATLNWSVEYSEYQSDGWFTCSLLNNTGKSSDNRIQMGRPVSTDALRQLPHTASLLEKLGFDIFWARLARLDPDSYLWEHVDYEEFSDVPAVRLHIPLDTHSGARIVFKDHSVWMSAGHVWRLNPRGIHGAANFGTQPRLHLIIDCHETPAIASLYNNESLPLDVIEALPPATEQQFENTLQLAHKMAASGDFGAAERVILTLFHRHALEPGYPYDLLLDFFDTLKLPERRDLWAARKALFLGAAAKQPGPAPSATPLRLYARVRDLEKIEMTLPDLGGSELYLLADGAPLPTVGDRLPILIPMGSAPCDALRAIEQHEYLHVMELAQSQIDDIRRRF